MHQQSTAPVPPRAEPRRRPSAWPRVLVLLFVVTIAAGMGLVLYSGPRPPVQVAHSSVEPAPTRPQPVGTIGTLGSVTEVWVDELDLSAWNRAAANRDRAGMERTKRLFEWFDIPVNAQVKITQRRGTAMQVEVLDGPQAGRRGWLDAADRVLR